MLEKLLQNKEVIYFINEIKTNDKYFRKNHEFSYQKEFFASHELALFIFYDALLKYQIIVNDEFLFDEFLEQLERLYRKLDDFENIRIGIHKLICKMVAAKLCVHRINSLESKKEIITYIYDKYITEGYFVHGFSGYYLSDILEHGFVPEQYDNYYPQYEVINHIFEKYGVSKIIPKNFNDDKVSYTDNFVMGCYYSIYAPMFFYDFLANKHFVKKNSKKDFFESSVEALKKFMNSASFKESDRKYVLDFVKKQRSISEQVDHDINLLLVKRKDVLSKEVPLQDYLDDEHDIYEIVDRLLSSKYNTISCTRSFSPDEILVVSFDSYYKRKKVERREVSSIRNKSHERERRVEMEFLNVYGNVSILLIVGALFISLGVIITILMILGG